MMKVLSLFALLAVVAVSAYAPAQEYNDGMKEELNQDIEQMYPKRPKKTADASRVSVQTVSAAQVQPAIVPAAAPAAQSAQPASANAGTTALQPIYILQQPASVPAPAAQVQPTTTVEAAPIQESKIDVLRKQREQIEHQTEDKLMQKLEDDRLLSEKERADRLFNPLPAPKKDDPAPASGPTSGSNNNGAAAPVAAVVVPAATTVLAPPTAAPVAPAPEVSVVSTKADVVAAPEQKPENSVFTLGAMGGIGAYTNNNISGVYAAGVDGRIVMPGRLGIDVTALFSSYDWKNSCVGYLCPNGNSVVKTIDQFNVTAGVTYNILEGRVSPVIGALAGYTRRTYTDRVTYFYSPNGTSSAGSNAFDAGLMAGLDINATKKLIIGADVRYMMNLSYRTDDALGYYFQSTNTSPLESQNYYIATLNLRLAL